MIDEQHFFIGWLDNSLIGLRHLFFERENLQLKFFVLQPPLLDLT